MLVDSTNTEPAVRAHLLQRARTWGAPTVAILIGTPLEDCLARQAERPAPKQVPQDAIIRQHAATSSREQLLADGWGQVHDAASIDLLELTLQRAAQAAAAPDLLSEIRALFGDDLAALFAYTDQHHERGRFTVAGRDIDLRFVGGEPYDRPWEARLTGASCDCRGDLWVPVGTPAELPAGRSRGTAVSGGPVKPRWRGRVVTVLLPHGGRCRWCDGFGAVGRRG